MSSKGRGVAASSERASVPGRSSLFRLCPMARGIPGQHWANQSYRFFFSVCTFPVSLSLSILVRTSSYPGRQEERSPLEA